MPNPWKDNIFKNLFFQEKWYKDYHWLHYDKDVKVVYAIYVT